MASMSHLLTRRLSRTLTGRLDTTWQEDAFTPLSLAPLAWYDVDPAYCYVERSAETTLSSVNGVVGTLRDRSGNANHLRAPSDVARPILRNSGALYWLEFDGVDDAMRAAFTVGTTFARYGALASISHTNNDRFYSGGAANYGELVQDTPTQIRQAHTGLGLVTTVPAVGTNFTTSETITGTTGSLSINAGALSSSTTFTANTPGGLTVGAFWNGSVYAVWGNIKFFGCTMRASVFTAPQLANLEIYYKAKAGL